MATQRTLAIIKPDAVYGGNVGNIIQRMEWAGLKILQMRVEQLTENRAERFYAEHKGKPFFPKLVKFMTSGTSIAVALEGDEAIQRWRDIIKTDVRPSYGSNTYSERNAVHGSDSVESADRELRYFFWDLGWPWSTQAEGWDA